MPGLAFSSSEFKGLVGSGFRKGGVLGLAALVLLGVLAGLYYGYISERRVDIEERNFRVLGTWSNELTVRLGSYKDAWSNRRPQTSPGVTCTGNRENNGCSSFKADGHATPTLFEHLQGVRHFRDKETSLSKQDISSQEIILKLIEKNKGKPSEPEEDFLAVKPFLLFPEMQSEEAFLDILLVDQAGEVILQKNRSGILLTSLKEADRLSESTGLGILTFLSSSENSTATKLIGDKGFPTPVQTTISLAGSTFRLFAQPVTIPTGVSLLGDEEKKQRILILCGLVPISDFEQQYRQIPLMGLVSLVFGLLFLVVSLPLVQLVVMNPRESLTRIHLMSITTTIIVGIAAFSLILFDWYTYSKVKEEFAQRLEIAAEHIHENFTIEITHILTQLTQYTKIKLLHTDLEQLELASSKGKGQEWIARGDAPCTEPEAVHQESRCTYQHDESLIMFLLDGNGNLRLNWTHRPDPYFEGTINVKDRLYVRHVLDREKPLFVAPPAATVRSYFIEPIISRDSAETTVVLSIPFSITNQLSDAEKEQVSGTWVAAMEQKLTSVMRPNSVPPGGGFAIIDNQTGQVLFHSNVYRNLRENFFQETDMNVELQALVHSKAADTFEGDYRGQGQQFYVKPIQHLPWTLIVFRSKEDLRTFNLGILLFSGSLLLLYFILLTGIFAFLLWCVRRKTQRRYLGYNPFQWLWPHPSHTKTYQLNSVLNLILLVVGLCIYVWVAKGFNGGRLLMGVAVVIPLMSFLGLLTCGFFPESEGPAGRTRFSLKEFSQSRCWFVGMVMAWVLILAAFPAGISFEIAKDRELRMFVSRILVGVQSTLNDASLQAPEFFSLDPIRKIEAEEDMASRDGQQDRGDEHLMDLSIHQVPVFYGEIVYPVKRFLLEKMSLQNGNESLGQQEADEGSFLDRYHQVARRKALNYPPLQESWGLLPPDRNSFQESILDSGEPAVRLEQAFFPVLLKNQPSQYPYTYFPLRLQAPLPEWIGPNKGFFAHVSRTPALDWMGSLIGMFFLLWLSLRTIVGRVFAVPYPGSQIGMLTLLPPSEDSQDLQHVLILGPPGSGKSRIPQDMNVGHAVIDCRKFVNEIEWFNEKLKGTSDKDIVFIDNFEFMLGSPRGDFLKSELVKQLLEQAKSIYILSTINPVSGPLPVNESYQGHESSDVSLEPYMVSDWASLLRGFSLLYCKKGTWESTVQSFERLSSDPIKRELELVRKLIRQESTVNAYLDKVGRWILVRKEDVTNWSEDDVVPQFLGVAKPYYQSVWETCSFEEQLALYELAKEGWLHARHPELPRLQLKGLVLLDPDVRLMNKSFRQFILSAGFKAQLSTSHRKDVNGTWSAIKTPLLLVVVAIFIFLFETQQELKNSMSALFGALPFLLPMASELAGSLFLRNQTSKSD